MQNPEQLEKARARQRAAMLCVIRETYPEATEAEVARLCDIAEREAEKQRRTLTGEKLNRIRKILFGAAPD